MAATLSVHRHVITGAIQTRHQLGGHGNISNTVLAVPSHLNGKDEPEGPWNSVEFVVLAPTEDDEPTRVGEHTQDTDEYYLLVEGEGRLTTHGREETVRAGDLILAPRGTRHSIANPSPDTALSFVVVELKAPATTLRPPMTINNLWARLAPCETLHAATLSTRDTRQPIQVAQVNLAQHFSASSWGVLSLLRLPPSARVGEYTLPDADEFLFVVNVREGFVTLMADGERYDSRMEGIGWEDSPPGDGLSAIIPAGMPRWFENRSSAEGDTLLMLSLEVRRALAAHVDYTQQTYQEAVA